MRGDGSLRQGRQGRQPAINSPRASSPTAPRNTVGAPSTSKRASSSLLTDERVDKPAPELADEAGFRRRAGASGRDVLVLEDLSVGYGEQALLSRIEPDAALRRSAWR